MAKCVLVSLRLTATASSADAKIHKNILGSRTTAPTTSNKKNYRHC